MSFTPIAKRKLKNVGKNIWHSIQVIENEFGGQLTHDSGHDKLSDEEATTWIFTFPRYGNAQIAIAMNKTKLSLLMRGKTVDGQQLASLISEIAVVEKTTTDPRKGVVSSVLGPRAPFLNPSPLNPLLRVSTSAEAMHTLLELYLGRSSIDSVPAFSLNESGDTDDSGDRPKSQTGVSEDALRNQLERNNETGRAGEYIAIQDEIERLRQLLCPEPERYVLRISESDVGRGYDIETTWPGAERCIEVKTTTRSGSDFFLTANEREVLTGLGERAWLYRVLLDSEGRGSIEAKLRNPMKFISNEQFVPVVWRVAGSAINLGYSESPTAES